MTFGGDAIPGGVSGYPSGVPESGDCVPFPRHRHRCRPNEQAVMFFVTLTKTERHDGDLGAPPYLYAGPITYTQHTGDRPMRSLWHLHHPLPADIFHAARVAAG
jgi:hypothetical protein